MRELAFLNKGIKLVVIDKTKKDKVFEYKFDGGLNEFINYLNQKKKN